jgi:hypothetical protein
MLAASIAVALAFWGPPPCELQVKVAELDGALGRATYGGEVCLVEIDARRWKWWELCYAMLHEVGHTHSLPHSEDPRSVMFPSLERPADACTGRRPADIRARSRHLLAPTTEVP